jgi:hypothetical protein
MGAERLPPWIDQKHAPGVRFVLSVVGLDGMRTPCDSYYCDQITEPQDVLELVEGRALAQANTIGSTHAFELRAETDAEVLGTEVFRVTAEALPGTGGGSIATEPANAGGLVAQAMRHTEAAVRSSVMAFEKVARTQNQIINRLADRLEHSETTHAQTMVLAEEAHSQQHERELELLDKTMTMDLKQQAAGKLMGLAPLVLDAVAAKRDPEGASSAVTGQHLLRDLVGSLSQDQVAHLFAGLDIEQQAKLGHLMKRLDPAKDEDVEKAAETETKSDAKH